MLRLNVLSITLIASLAAMIQQPAFAQPCAITEDQRFVHPGPAEQSTWFGREIAASGEWVIAGVRQYQQSGVATGAAYMLKKTAGQWSIAQTLLAPDGAAGDEFGSSVDIDGPWAVVGAINDDHSGASNNGSVHIFAIQGEQWVHHTALIGSGVLPTPTTGERFGASVAISGNTILVGAPWASTVGLFFGAVYVFDFDGTQWIEQEQIYSANDPPGTNFGFSVALEGDAAFISRADAWNLPTSAPNVQVLRRSGEAWAFEQALTPGSAVFAISGDRAVIGLPNPSQTNAAFVYEHDGRAWNLMQELLPPTTWSGNFGAAVAIQGDRILVGAPLAHATYQFPAYSSNVTAVGQAFQFRFDGNNWIEHTRMQPAYYDYDVFLPQPDDFQFGYGVAFVGDEAIIGAPTFNAPEAPMIFSFALEPDDCDSNGVHDPCDPDCNFNLVNDACEIAAGATGDCNANATPDVCEQSARYLLDDGVGAFVFGLFQDGGDYIWLNQFNVLPGGEHITHISLVWTAYTFEGTPGTLMLYDDPNDDGDPNDAVLLASFPLVGHGVFGLNGIAFTIEAIERTFVGDVGESFFVGVMMPNPIDHAHAVSDGAPSLQRSWRAYAPLGKGNFVDLSANQNPPALASTGNWMLRAHALDCNGNGTWDQCDIDSGVSLDLNANGIPDECDQPCFADINNSGGVDVSDLLALINAWGPCPQPCPADINGSGLVDVSDLLAVINAWGDCP